jgi:hypothetical protein
MRHICAATTLLLAASLYPRPAAARPVVLELFTSQSCSSCPPAEALLTRLQGDTAGITTLSFHVDYWDYLRWRDPFSLPEATARQRVYAALLGTGVFTPQLVIDGRASAVGSDEPAIRGAIAAAARAQAGGPVLSVARRAGVLAVTVGAGAGPGDLLLVGYDPTHRTHVGAGENGGVVLDETNVVRSLRRVAAWTGQPIAVSVPLLPGERHIVLLQRRDGTLLASGSAEK